MHVRYWHGYLPTRARCDVWYCLRARYVMSGTDIARARAIWSSRETLQPGNAGRSTKPAWYKPLLPAYAICLSATLPAYARAA
eukprot:807941-Rhodomonas_salina.1